jgi:hypothetical protein
VQREGEEQGQLNQGAVGERLRHDQAHLERRVRGRLPGAAQRDAAALRAQEDQQTESHS